MFGADNINFKFIHLNLYVQFFQGKHEREEEERKRRIQLYVFISRCISYPFNAKQPTDMTKRQTKNKQTAVGNYNSAISSKKQKYYNVLKCSKNA